MMYTSKEGGSPEGPSLCCKVIRMGEKKSDPFYHSAAWKRVRALALQRDHGMCQDCMDRLRAGYGIRPNRAQMVHHIIPLSERPDLALSLSNLRSLCNECHNKNHPERRQAKQREVPAGMRVIKA